MEKCVRLKQTCFNTEYLIICIVLTDEPVAFNRRQEHIVFNVPEKIAIGFTY